VIDKLKYFIEAWEMNGVGQTIAKVQDGPGSVVTITIDELRALAAGAAVQEPVGIVAKDEVHGWHFAPSVDWESLGLGANLYAAPVPREAATVPPAVIAWRDAYQEYANATDAYNKHLEYVRANCPFGTSVDAQYQAMNEAQRKAFALLKPMHAALADAAPYASAIAPTDARRDAIEECALVVEALKAYTDLPLSTDLVASRIRALLAASPATATLKGGEPEGFCRARANGDDCCCLSACARWTVGKPTGEVQS
jgi:hypothetical protein